MQSAAGVYPPGACLRETIGALSGTWVNNLLLTVSSNQREQIQRTFLPIVMYLLMYQPLCTKLKLDGGCCNQYGSRGGSVKRTEVELAIWRKQYCNVQL